MKRIIVKIDENTANLRADIALSKLTNLSRHHIKILTDAGYVYKNDQLLNKTSYKTALHDIFQIDLETYQKTLHNTQTIITDPTDINIEFLYEDDFLLIVNKPIGMVVHPAPGHTTNTLSQILEHYFQQKNQMLSTFSNRPGIIHRLDKETSGIMLIAKTDKCHEMLQKQFSNRQINKIYLAHVHNTSALPKHFWLVGKVGPHESKPQLMQAFNQKLLLTYEHNKYELCKDMLCNLIEKQIQITHKQNIDHQENNHIGQKTQYKNAITECVVYNDNLLLCLPHTGRQHQIRVQLKKAGYPITGDILYNSNYKQTDQQNRQTSIQHLHAIGIRFNHPILENTQISVLCPAEFYNKK